MNPVEPHALQLPLLLAVLAAPIGALDVLWFHIWKFRLYEAPSSRAETAIHLVRGAGFSAAVFMLANFRFAGAWFWLVGALFMLDVCINVLDVLVEPRSRAPLGGIPRLEYLLHVVGSMFAGAVAASYFIHGWADQSMPTALLTIGPALPRWLVQQGNVVAAGGALLTLVETGLYFCSRTVLCRSSTT